MLAKLPLPLQAAVRRAVTPSQAEQARSRQLMLQRVRAFWIDGVLAHSLHATAPVTLGLTSRLGAVTYPWAMILQEPAELDRPLPPDTTVTDVFDRQGGSLLILGAPGSGKTVILLQLAKALLARAAQDDTCPMPVVFNLSSWGQARKPLAGWLVDELNVRYSVPRKIGQAWLQASQVLPLLDGLDEVDGRYRAACVAAVNSFRTTHALGQMVVCSRTDDYLALPVRLQLEGAVQLQPLTPEQIDAYLCHLGDQGDTIRSMVRQDPGLGELAQSPLMLNLLAMTYHGLPAAALPHAGSLEEMRKQIFAAYVDCMFKRRGGSKRYSPEKTTRWLGRLASRMAERSQSIFVLEQLQPDWLARRRARFAYLCLSRLLAGFILGIVVAVGAAASAYASLAAPPPERLAQAAVAAILGCLAGLAAGAAGALVEFWRYERPPGPAGPARAARPAWLDAILWLLVFAAAGAAGAWLALTTLLLTISALATPPPGSTSQGALPPAELLILPALLGIFAAVVVGPIFGLRARGRSYAADISTVEAFRFSERRGLLGALGGLAVGVGLALVSSQGNLPASLLNYCLRYGLLGVLIGGLSARQVDTRTEPNSGIRRSAYKAALLCITATAGLGIVGAALGDPANSFRGAVIIGLLLFAWFGGLDVVHHYVLRALLALRSDAPWNYARFLDYAAERIFMQKAGMGYVFVHRALLEHFAATATATAATAAPADAATAPGRPAGGL